MDIGHDGKNPGSAWLLSKVDVAEMATGAVSSFPFGGWLTAESKPVANRAVLELGRAADDGKHLWTVETVTSNVRGAGTDANVSIVIFGDEGATEQVPLDNSSNNFERGRTDTFHFKARGVGKAVTHIQLGHDGSGAGSAWHVASVRVQDNTAGVGASFPVNGWFSTTDPPCKTTQVLYPSGNQAVRRFARADVFPFALAASGRATLLCAGCAPLREVWCSLLRRCRTSTRS